MMKKGFVTIILSARNHGCVLANHQHQCQNRIFMERRSCCAFDGIKSVQCIMNCCNRVKLSMLNNTNINYSIWIEQRQTLAKRQNYFSSQHMTTLKSYIAEPVQNLGGTWMGCLTPPYSPDIAPSDYHLFRSKQHGLSEQHFSYFEAVKK